MSSTKKLGDCPPELAQARAANWRTALASPFTILRDRLRVRLFREKLRRHATGPAVFHILLAQDDSEPFPFHAAMAAISARAWHPDASLHVYALKEPQGPFWDLIRHKVTLIILPDICWFGFAPLQTTDNWLEIVKLIALTELGGRAIDSDVIVTKNSDDLLGNAFVLGVQAGIPGGRSAFGTAFMAATKGSAFGLTWLDAYRRFGGRGGDLNRDFFSMHLPLHLYARMPEAVTILTHDRLYFPIMYRVQDYLFNETKGQNYLPLSRDQYAVPLWHRLLGNALDGWTPEKVVASECLYALLCRSAFTALPAADLAEIAEKLELSAAALIRPASSTSVTEPTSAEGIS